MLLLTCLFAICVHLVTAIYSDEAGVVDWHYSLVGLPQTSATFFHRPHQGSRASLLYTLSEAGVIGAVNPRDGSIVWRQKLETIQHGTRGLLKAVDGNNVILSAWNDTLQAWNAHDGRFIWKKIFSKNVIVDVGVSLASVDGENTGRLSAFVALEGDSPGIICLDARDGHMKWAHQDASGEGHYQLSTSKTKLYAISLHQALLKGSKVRVTTLEEASGKNLEQITLSSDSEVFGSENMPYVGQTDALPLIVWTDHSKSTIKTNVLGSKAVSSFDFKKHGTHVESVNILAPTQAGSDPHFLVHYQGSESHWAEVFHLDEKTSTVKKAYELPKLAGRGAFAVSTMDSDVYFTRITQEEKILVSSKSHGILSRWPIRDFGVSGLQETPFPIHATSEVALRAKSVSSVRSAVLLSTGDWSMVRNGEPIWNRPEALSNLTQAVWTEELKAQSSAATFRLGIHSNPFSAYAHRLIRHVEELCSAHIWLQSVPRGLIDHFINVATKSKREFGTDGSFGLNKLVKVLTGNGRLIIIDATNGGQILSNTASSNGKGKGDLGSITSTFADSYRDGGNVHQRKNSSDTFNYQIFEGSLQGQKGISKIWHFAPPNGQRLLAVHGHPASEPIASIGKVLGDRSVLYKYLNANSIIVTAAKDASKHLFLYLLDSFSGSVLYSADHQGVDLGKPIPVLLSENWLCYSYATERDDEESSRGYELTVAELFESQFPNDRGSLDTSTDFKSTMPNALLRRAGKPHVVSQSFKIPEMISDMAVTQTSQGITSRQLLVSLPDSNAIVGIPRQVLDPRRPVGVDPTAAQAEEGLIRYVPTIEFDPRWFLSHNEELLDVRHMMTTPTSLESTGLVFAYGHDLFGTKVSPSFAFDILGRNFNKVQLMLTVVALTIGVFFVGPLVKRKQTNILWQSA